MRAAITEFVHCIRRERKWKGTANPNAEIQARCQQRREVSEPIPDDPKLQLALAERWSETLDFSEYDRPDEPGAWNLVYSLWSIQESCRALLDDELPKLISASAEQDLRDALQDVALELSHVLYHARDARYFEHRLLPSAGGAP
jgi:hypothetical protein